MNEPKELARQFRKKPVVISAIQWTGDNWLEVNAFANTKHIHTDANGLAIDTLEGQHRADVGDWIIRGVKGELYPCKPDIFAATYEPAVAASLAGGATQTGWKLVPVEPTDEMEAAAEDDYENTGSTFPEWKSAYRAMLNAAPPSPAEPASCEGRLRKGDMRIKDGLMWHCTDPEIDRWISDGEHVAEPAVEARDEREAFESVFENEPFNWHRNLWRDDKGEYGTLVARTAWAAWQARALLRASTTGSEGGGA